MKPQLPLPCIVDADRASLEAILSDPLAIEDSPFLANDASTALYDLERNTAAIAGVFVNANIGKKSVTAIAEFMKAKAPAIPLYLVYDESVTVKMEPAAISTLNVRSTLSKPLKYEEMKSMLVLAIKADETKALASNTGALAKAARSEGYMILPSDTYVAGVKVENDIFVRTAPGKYQQVMSAGDELVAEVLEEAIFIRADEYQSLTISTVAKGEETKAVLRDIGVTKEALEEATTFVHAVDQLVRQMPVGDAQGVGSLLATLSQKDHAVSTTILASMFLRPMGLQSDKGLNIIGLAALSHDVGLSDETEFLALKDVELLTDYQRKDYHQHPITSAALLEFVPGVDPETVKAILQHHERRSKTGFPNQLGGDEITPFAEILGLANLLSESIERYAKGFTQQNPFVAVEKKLAEDFSANIIQAYRKIFNRRG